MQAAPQPDAEHGAGEAVSPEVRAEMARRIAAGSLELPVLLPHVATQILGGMREDVGLAVLASHHAAVGQRLAERWALPEPVVAAIAHHHDFAAAQQHATAAAIACLANLLAHLILDRPESEPALRAHPVCAALNLYPEDIDGLLAKGDAMRELAEAFMP